MKTATVLFFVLFHKVFSSSTGKIQWLKLSPSELPLGLHHPDGFESDSQTYTYICRTNHGYDRVVGKLLFHIHYTGASCRFAWNGNELHNSDMMILSRPPGSVSWEEFEGGLPYNAIIGGYVSQYNQYICRGICRENGMSVLLIGAYTPALWNTCRAAWGTERILVEFEVLVKNEYGLLIDV